MMDKFINQAAWMRNIPDSAPLAALSIPGTHNSCCDDGPLGLAKTQNLDLSDQLLAGIRFLDIRLALCGDSLCVHHDVVCMEMSYADVLVVCADFLRKYSSETIFLSVSDESVFGRRLGRFAPSRILCSLPAGRGSNCEEGWSFDEVFKVQTWENAEDALFYNYTEAPLGDDSAVGAPAFTSATTLGDTRGRIVLLRRFDSNRDLGFDLTYWPENQRFRSASLPVYHIEDQYQNPGDEDKLDLVVTHLEEARKGNPGDLYITFSSAVDLAARGYSRSINPRLSDYLAETPAGRVGIIVMDYFEEPRELVSRVIRTNFPATAAAMTSGHREQAGGR